MFYFLWRQWRRRGSPVVAFESRRAFRPPGSPFDCKVWRSNAAGLISNLGIPRGGPSVTIHLLGRLNRTVEHSLNAFGFPIGLPQGLPHPRQASLPVSTFT